jgi:adenylyl-sulfate kinase
MNNKNISWQEPDIDENSRVSLMGHKSICLWLTGLSGAGKSTISIFLEKKLFEFNIHTIILDGDNLRHGINQDLGFNDISRKENIRRAAEIAKLTTSAGLVTIVSLISPYSHERELAKSIFPQNKFFEIYINSPIELCEKRDVKGLYAKARLGQIDNFTGISSPYEIPKKPDLIISTENKSPSECADEIFIFLKKLIF